MDWITCPGCGLKHSPRSDGLCPRCRTRIAATGPQGPQPPPLSPPSAFGASPSSPFDPPTAQPMPTSAWGGGQPLPTSFVGTGAEITVGSIVSKTFSIWWANFGKFFGTLLLAYLPLLAIGVLGVVAAGFLKQGGGGEGATPPALMAIVPVLVIAVIAFIPLLLAQFGGVVYATLQHMAGKTTTVGAMFSVGIRRAWALFVAGAAASLLIMAGFIALIVPGVIAALGLSIVYAVAVAEKVTAVEAIKRSFTLTKGKRGTIVGALFVVMCAMWAASLVGNVATAMAQSNQVAALGGAILSLVLQVALTPLSTVAIAVAYHDLRVAKEGADTSQLASVFE